MWVRDIQRNGEIWELRETCQDTCKASGPVHGGQSEESAPTASPFFPHICIHGPWGKGQVFISLFPAISLSHPFCLGSLLFS